VTSVRDLVHAALGVLELLAVLAALALFAIVVIGLIAALVRVSVRGRVLVLPFRGTDSRRGEITEFFVWRLMMLEQEWVRLARAVEERRKTIGDRSARTRPAARLQDDATPLTSGGRVARLPSALETRLAQGGGPRPSGDELLPIVERLEGPAAIADADLGAISFGGVSFSPATIVALVRAASAIAARRLLQGTVASLGDTAVLSVAYAERSPRRRRQTAVEPVLVAKDEWLTAIDQLAYALAKNRVYLLRAKGEGVQAATDLLGTRSHTVDRATVEAETWAACKAFLSGYAAHLDHFVSGDAADRERALACYGEALRVQPQYPRALYNRATMLYNRYLPKANRQAIEDFEAACKTDDETLRPLVLAGLAMAYCQEVQRFGSRTTDAQARATEATVQAARLDRALPEARFAIGWTHQVAERWDRALHAYARVERADDATPATRRIISFALNNAAYIWMHHLVDRPDALARAEALLWRAHDYYPNKVAYANLGEIARRLMRFEDAVALYRLALALDPAYANALSELSCVELAFAADQRRHGDDAAADTLAAAEAQLAAAEAAAEDPEYAKRFHKAFEEAWAAHAADLDALADAAPAEPAAAAAPSL
jgi:tetratricopeptide (TPR) repeat protein